jgi:hypothetical protein
LEGSGRIRWGFERFTEDRWWRDLMRG